ncbi:hypothetical protein CC1G_00172 [Coprinopsis cinerea okayama7|uniref:PEBP-like protein n=1 Tax=Coprinopsis cinerea (strain Okayama-7 / 130 / ATCC MYA-4618 / FGSC 9003) TaxID=240176 RepID=A8NX10_COPC7|nr:hypothetical protein CC1G_00172 [Coprinopsis cinerea okayama7\|eukprot:XP_001837036.2 hypothetical protein CC1G_00172 [Coprinopsis cinerea okayama7\
MAGEEFEIMAGETLITALTDNDPKFSMTLNGTDEDSTPTGGPYVVMLLDPNGSRPENGTGRNQVLHLMRGGFSAGRSDGSIESNTEPIARYSKPAPVGEEVHRYVVLVYNQPDDFEERASDRVDVEERDSFNLTSFVRGTNLGNPIAGTYFLLEPSGTSTSVRSSSTTTRSTGAFNTEGIPPTFTPLIGQGQKHVAALGSLFGLCFAGLTLLVA